MRHRCRGWGGGGGKSFCIFFFLFSVSGSLSQHQYRDSLFAWPTCRACQGEMLGLRHAARPQERRGRRPAPLLNPAERGPPDGAEAELRDDVAASDGARFAASVVVIRQGNEAGLFCSDAGGLLDVLAAAVGADGPATDCPASGTVTFMVRLKNKNLN